ncbi:hypothetical protein [Ligilactobacillus salivarius]|uniref:hypothetical protein n=1 Tax=Ligilactobacillus salivarius TaxID=1624 RepID=UPI001FB21B26|nr:hypothetical protein [Ligilactobacillus salivarius]
MLRRKLMPNYVIVRNKDEKPMEYYRQKTKTFVGSLQSASKWNSKKWHNQLMIN